MKRRIICLFVLLLTMWANADLVHVVEQKEVGGVTTVISDETKLTGMPWLTATAPAVSGHIFTHWTISTKQEFVARDEWGRAYDAPSFKLYEDTTLTAHYLPATQDTDEDGVSDGYEIYWYGNLTQGATSDTDGDGWTFKEELANGTNPLTPEVDVEGPVAYGDGDLLLYNPSNYASVAMWSDPAGLFSRSEEWLRPGTYAATGSYSPTTSKFAYWTRNGVVIRDAWGRAVDQLTFMMSSNNEELVAVIIDDYDTRMKLYWYGTTEIAMDSDTDGDGFTFAEELVNGTNPLTPEVDVDGPIAYADGELLQYNPRNLQPYTIMSDPEGALFETINDYAPYGTFVDATAYSPNTSTFACWMLNGVEQRDAWGRAVEKLSLQMGTNAQVLVAKVVEDDVTRQKYYWYGTTDVAMDSDTDGDGVILADELANGTNPLTPESEVDGPITYADTELHEANLQPFEQAQGALVDGEYRELFYSPITENADCTAFGTNAVPNVVDVNGDGLFDLVIVSQTGYAVLVNIGSVGNPQFAYRSDVPTNGLSLVKGGLERLEGLLLDVTPTDAISCTFGDVDQDGVEDLLVSDAEGRIWYYHNSRGSYYLQNKVWAGSSAGFANQLYLASVDWDGDGDLDCVCGTAEGRLMLLVDPRIGRPMNVRAQAGVDSVVLSWDPSVNSRVRGYGVFRGVDTNNYDRIQSLWPLPAYRDIPDVLRDYYYRVTSMSRHYISGNSTPIVSESLPTDAVHVQFRPNVWLNDTSSFTDTNVEVIVSINNTMGILADDFSMTFSYDPQVLTPVAMKTTGITEDLIFNEEKAKGEGEAWNWKLQATGGKIGAGAGRFLRLVFYVKPVKNIDETIVSLMAATVKASDGHPVELELPKSCKILLAERKTPEPAGVAMNVSTVYADTMSTFSLPIVVTSTKTLTYLSVNVGWDADILEVKGAEVGTLSGHTLTIRGTVPGVICLTFYAKDQHAATQTAITLSSASARCTDGLAAKITTVNGTVYLTDSNVPEPITMTVATWHSKVKSGESFKVPIGATTSGDLAKLTVDVDWDASQLIFTGCPAAKSITSLSANSCRLVFDCSGNYNLFNLDFTAPTISGLQASSWTRVVAASGMGRNGLAATVQTEFPRIGNVIIVREVGRYEPGDIDGDGAYTANDLMILNGYVVYLKMASKGAAFGNSYATTYQKQYGVNVKLSGSAARAADVNCDGAVNSSDIAMLQMFIKEAEGVGK